MPVRPAETVEQLRRRGRPFAGIEQELGHRVQPGRGGARVCEAVRIGG
ncbi:hypothetical protein [Pseudonocardia sp. ICBG1293]|nr:hypothetical protein [Pseudonocardia sp. ICBG1293]